MQRLVAETRKEAPVSRLCKVFGVSRSGWYAARARQQQIRALSPEAAHLQASFAASHGTYGSRRLSASLRAAGFEVGRHRTRTLMQQHGLRAKARRAWRTTTQSRHDLPVAGNVLQRRFSPTTINQAWACDITYIRTGSRWLYLAAVMDLHSRRIVGWAMAPSLQARLVCEALRTALVIRQPKPGLIVHSDRGSQYAGDRHRRLLEAWKCVPSMSRKGNCWDNAVMERFFLSLKLERVWQRSYANPMEAQRDIADYIVNFYNTQRLHSTLGYKSPAAFEQAAR